MPWPEDIAKLAAAVPNLTIADLPQFPFKLQPFVTITGPQWLASLKAEVASGADGARFKLGVLQGDLRWLLYRLRVHEGNGPAPMPPEQPGPPPRPKGVVGANKRTLLDRLELIKKERGLSRADINVTLKRERSTTLSTAKKEDLEWLLKMLNP